MEDGEKLQHITAEICAYRQYQTTYFVPIHQAIVGAVVILITFSGVYFRIALSSKPELRLWLLFLLSQMEFGLVLYCQQQMAIIQVTAAYIAGLENRANQLAGEVISYFESGVGKKYLASFRGIPYWTGTYLWILLLGGFLWMFGILGLQFKSAILDSVLAVELLVAVFFAVWLFKDPDRVRHAVLRTMGQPVTNLTTNGESKRAIIRAKHRTD